MRKDLIHPEFWRGRKVLITGHTGFKGSWLALWLSEMGAKITGIGLNPDTSNNLYTQIQLDQRLENNFIVDIRDAQSVKNIIKRCKPEAAFHLAAQPLVRESYQNPIGTWETNVIGSLNILEGLKSLEHFCSAIMITTDKVYKNKEWIYGYRENDELGGYDPYSASKAAAEIGIESWRNSFCGNKKHQAQNLAIATARSGNVIGGGDYAAERIIPDTIRSIIARKKICIRNPKATRPWQHVLEPLSGYLCLSEKLTNEGYKDNKQGNRFCTAFNFGPSIGNNKTVQELVEESLRHWPGEYELKNNAHDPHEANLLHLQIDKAINLLGWQPKLDFKETVRKTIIWYKRVHEAGESLERCLEDIKQFSKQ